MAVDAEHPSALIGNRRGQFPKQVTVQIETALNVMLCRLHSGVFFLVLPRHIDAVAPVICIFGVWLLGGVVDDSPADEVTIGGLFIGDSIPHDIGAVADLPYPILPLLPLI